MARRCSLQAAAILGGGLLLIEPDGEEAHSLRVLAEDGTEATLHGVTAAELKRLVVRIREHLSLLKALEGKNFLTAPKSTGD